MKLIQDMGSTIIINRWFMTDAAFLINNNPNETVTAYAHLALNFETRFSLFPNVRRVVRTLIPASAEMMHLDVLRIVASCAIVFHHSKEFFFSASARPEVLERFSGLLLFVDLFFAISGFVISYVYAGRIQSLPTYGRFMQKRIGRLVPLHFLTLGLNMLVWAIILQLGLRVNRPPSFSPACVIPTMLLLHSFVHCGSLAFNAVSWSISAEMVMYAIFPALAWIGKKYPSLLIVIFLISLAVDVAEEASKGLLFDALTWEHLSGPIRALPSFSFGCLLFANRERLRGLPFAEALLVGALAITFVLIGFSAPAISTLATMYLVVIAAVACDVRNKPSSVVVKLAPLGQMTYSVYMWHPLVILLTLNAADKLFHPSPQETIALAVVCYAAIVAVAYFSFVYVETPARKWFDSLFTRDSAASSSSEKAALLAPITNDRMS